MFRSNFIFGLDVVELHQGSASLPLNFTQGAEQENPPLTAEAWFRKEHRLSRLIGQGQNSRRFRVWSGITPGVGTKQMMDALARAPHQPSLRLLEWPTNSLYSKSRRQLSQKSETDNRILQVNGQLLEVDHPAQALACFFRKPMVAIWAEDSPRWILAHFASGAVLGTLIESLESFEDSWKDKKRYALLFVPEEGDCLTLPNEKTVGFVYTMMMLLSRFGIDGHKDEDRFVQVICKTDELVMVSKT